MGTDKRGKRNLRLVDKFDSDDYSRFAGPDYSDHPFELGEMDLGHSPNRKTDDGSWHHPGFSGYTGDEERDDFSGVGPKDYKRSDERIYEDVCEALMQDRGIDASNIGVKVEAGMVIISGKVLDREMKKNAEVVIEKISGVFDVRNELVISSNPPPPTGGPDHATRNDLGIT